jgi:membrane-bound metal-dependent hydrolase YbcI (DUF457 family)
MDNLTHSLVGAVLGQMGLKAKTGLAMPTLILAANLPDIDAACVVYGIESLSMRRGITHGPIALIVLPLLLWAVMIAFDGWQTRRGKRPTGRLPVHKGWLLALAYIGCLSHPALDWLNNYGIRLLEPFSHRWYYGDSLFIIDLWIWIVLGLSVGLSLRRERRGATHWRWPAWMGFAAVGLYIGVNGLITTAAERTTAEALRAGGRQPAAAGLLEARYLLAHRRPLWSGKLYPRRGRASRPDRRTDRHERSAFGDLGPGRSRRSRLSVLVPDAGRDGGRRRDHHSRPALYGPAGRGAVPGAGDCVCAMSSPSVG